MVMGRMVRPLDFQRVLGTAPCARSAHFAVHHLPQEPSKSAAPKALKGELSTGGEQTCPQLVEDQPRVDPIPVVPGQCWLGLVVPKRHAKRSVTRNLVKRQIRAAVGRADARPPGLQPGMWVVRLRAPIDRKAFPSAASDALRSAVRDELSQMMARAFERRHG